MSEVVRRALFHLFIVSLISVAALFAPKVVFLIVLRIIGSAFLIFELLRLRFPHAKRWFYRLFGRFLREEEAHRLTGASYTLMASLIIFHVFPEDVAIVVFIFLAIGDPVATLVGNYLGRISIFDKTLEGHLACFGTCILAGFIFSQLITPIPVIVVLAGSIGATVGEAVPHKINDNLTIPLLAAAAMMLAQT